MSFINRRSGTGARRSTAECQRGRPDRDAGRGETGVMHEAMDLAQDGRQRVDHIGAAMSDGSDKRV